MESWNQRLALIKAHQPLKEAQVMKALDEANVDAKSFEAKYTRRVILYGGSFLVVMISGLVAFLTGDKFIPYGTWIGLALLLFAAFLFFVTNNAVGAVDDNDRKIESTRFRYRVLNAKEVGALAEVAEQSPKITTVLQSWLDANLQLRGVEYALITGSEDALRANLSQLRIRHAAGPALSNR